jgi:hypothetical protein
MVKEYYLPRTRSIIVGVILVIMGLFPIIGVALIEHSIKAGLSFYLSGFISFPEIILSVIFLVILISGVLYLKNSGKIVRLKLDEKGVYYLSVGEGTPSKYKPLFNLFYLKEDLQLIPYSNIAKATCLNDKWLGTLIVLELKNGQIKRITALPVSIPNIKEIVTIINSRIDYGETDITNKPKR